MRSPAAAIAWQFRQRHRWGFLALSGYLLLLVTIRLLAGAKGLPVDLDTPRGFALVVVVPLATTFMYLLAVFSFGLAGDLAARESIYPTRMFTLPVSSHALAGWPMLYGAAAMVLLWLVTRLFAQWPMGVAIPRFWPGLLAVVLLAWTQALTWMSYGLRGLRVVVAVLWLCLIDTVVLLALHFHASESVMLAILAPHLPLAYLAAHVAVTRARRGDVPDWRNWVVRMRRRVVPGCGFDAFPSPAQAQRWFEWRRQGRSLPALVGILLPFELALLFAAGDAAPLVGLILLAVLLTPLFMATFVAVTERRIQAGGGDGYGVPPFLATRPLPSVALVAAKLRMAFRSTMTAWLLVGVALPLGLRLSGTLPLVSNRVSRVIDVIGMSRAMVVGLLVLLALLVSTWKQLVQSLYIGLSGREWVIKSSAFAGLLVLALIGPVVLWLMEDGPAWVLWWDVLPWILAFLAGAKLSVAAWLTARLHDGRLVTDRVLVTGVAGWMLVVLVLHGLLRWLVDTAFVPTYLLLLIAILATPLARIAAAPLALAWNRHR